MYLSLGACVRFPRKAKTPLVRGVEEIVRWQCRDHLCWCSPGCYRWIHINLINSCPLSHKIMIVSPYIRTRLWRQCIQFNHLSLHFSLLHSDLRVRVLTYFTSTFLTMITVPYNAIVHYWLKSHHQSYLILIRKNTPLL
jgi:hypothetical protein